MAQATTERSAPIRPGRARLFRLILVTGTLVIVGLGVLAAETAARYYERHRTTPPDYFPSAYYPHRRLRYALVPSIDYYGWFRINSRGFRGREIADTKQPGTFRIVCIGGSTTFDIGSVGSAKAWPEVLEDELRRSLGSDSIEVLNLGIGGATSLDSLIDLQIRALDLAPDLLLVYQGHNDFNYSIPPARQFPSELFPMEDSPRSSFIRWLTYNSLLYAKTEGRVRDRIGRLVGVLSGLNPFPRDDGTPTDRDAAIEEGIAAFRINMRSIAAIASANGIPLLLPAIVLPFPDGTGTPCATCDGLGQLFGGLNTAQVRVIVGRYNLVMEELSMDREGVQYLPTSGFVPSEDAYYSDPIHFGPEGSRRMGVGLAEALTPIVLEMTDAVAATLPTPPQPSARRP